MIPPNYFTRLAHYQVVLDKYDDGRYKDERYYDTLANYNRMTKVIRLTGIKENQLTLINDNR